jgi:CBS domain-containing protein
VDTIATPTIDNLNTFLARYPPFDALALDELSDVISRASVLDFGAGQAALVEDGLPAAGLWVLLSGSMELVHQGEVVQVIEPGECFGHPSLLSGLSPTFTVRAREAARCAVLPKADGERVLGTPAGAAYIASTMRNRLTRTGHTVHSLIDVGTTPAAAIMRPARFCEPTVDLREAARRLDEDGAVALLVEIDGTQLGIVADADIRRAVAAGEPLLDAPVRELARAPVLTVTPRQLAVDVVVDMLAAGTEHAAVADHGRVVGLVSASDLLGLEARSPMALRHMIMDAGDEAELIGVARRLPKLFSLLMSAGVPAGDICRVLSLQHDAVVSRLIDFSMARHGAAPVAWAWLDLGSAARREFTLGSDQDNALAYADLQPGTEEEVDAYFARMGSEVNDGMARCGIGVDNNGVMAGQRLWRMSERQWLRTFSECLRDPTESHLIRATVAFDFRSTAGGLSVAAQLTEQIRAAREHAAFMRLLARSATGFAVALNFRGHLAAEKSGPAAGRIDLKRSGIVPLVNLVRFHALANGVTISPTLDRIEAVRSIGGLDTGVAETLQEAFEVITRVRLECHAEAIAAGRAADNLVDPDELTPIVQSEVREALAAVRRAQRRVGDWGVPIR